MRQVAAALLLLAALLLAAPARAADLVVWWDKSFYTQEEAALAAMTRDFKAQTGLEIEFVRYDQWNVTDKIEAAIAAGGPPDFLRHAQLTASQVGRWARDGQLVELSGAVGATVDL